MLTDRRDGQRRQPTKVGSDFVALAVRAQDVDDDHPIVADDRPDVLVVEGVPADEDPIADLQPASRSCHPRTVYAVFDQEEG